MQKNEAYENFPVWASFLSWSFSLSLYILGSYILGTLYFPLAIVFIFYCLWVELRILKYSCVNCYYYGKHCGLGRGKLCRLLFKKGSPEKFNEKEISWKDLIPDFMVLIFPLVGGIVFLILDFSLLILILTVVLVLLSTGGNAMLRGSLACKYCKQKELGCQAEQLFSKKTKPTD
ncbi:MAG: hypothetical protein JW837_08825 [Sedimentisphaerales bacterium]|nr:hypothetical protein [Sedimentisphaerales bacterium]